MGNINNEKSSAKKVAAWAEYQEQINQIKRDRPVTPEELPDTAIYGANIKEFRTRIQMSAKELAKRIGITPASLSAIEHGKRAQVDIDMLYAIVAVLQCSVDNLLGRTKKWRNTVDGGVSLYNPFEQPNNPVKKLLSAESYLATKDLSLLLCITELLERRNEVIYKRMKGLLKNGFYDIFGELPK